MGVYIYKTSLKCARKICVLYCLCKLHLNEKRKRYPLRPFSGSVTISLVRGYGWGHAVINTAFCKPSDSGAVGSFVCRVANIYFNEDKSLLPPGWKRFNVINLTPSSSGEWCPIVGLTLISAKLDTERQKLYDLSYMWNLKKSNLQNLRIEWWLPWTEGWEKWADFGHRV